jgi:hypothetical protein
MARDPVVRVLVIRAKRRTVVHHFGFIAMVYLIVLVFGLTSPLKELYVMLAYFLCCYDGDASDKFDLLLQAASHWLQVILSKLGR